MPDLHDEDDETVILDLIHDAVDALANAIPLATGELFAPVRTRVVD